MILDFTGRRPLPVRDYVVSIEDGPKSEITCQKFGDSLYGGIRPIKSLT